MSVVEFTEEDLSAPEPRIEDPKARVVMSIARRIARSHGTTWEEMRSRSTLEHHVAARRDFYLELRGLGWSYPAIAKTVGRDHTTVLEAVTRRRKERGR